MRDRLIELLKQAEKQQNLNAVCGDIDSLIDSPKGTEFIADYLLANGVIVPPCKVGDKIYYIDRHTKKIDEDTVRYFTVTKDGCRAILDRHNIKFWDLYEWGKTVFVKKEEAERALKGGV